MALGGFLAVLSLALLGHVMATPEDKAWAERWVKRNLQPWAIGFWILLALWIAVCELG